MPSDKTTKPVKEPDGTAENPVSLTVPAKKKSKTWVVALVIILLLILEVVGVWYYMNQKAKKQQADMQNQINQLNKQINDLKSKQSTSSSTTSTDPTANWKTYTTPQEKLTFKYPPEWDFSAENGELAPGEAWNLAKLKGPNNFEVSIHTGASQLGGGCTEECQKVAFSDIVSTLNFYPNKTTYGIVTGFYPTNTQVGAGASGTTGLKLGVSNPCYFNICYGPTGVNTQGSILFSAGYLTSDNGYKYVEPSTFKADENVKTAEQVLQSFKY